MTPEGAIDEGSENESVRSRGPSYPNGPGSRESLAAIQRALRRISRSPHHISSRSPEFHVPEPAPGSLDVRCPEPVGAGVAPPSATSSAFQAHHRAPPTARHAPAVREFSRRGAPPSRRGAASSTASTAWQVGHGGPDAKVLCRGVISKSSFQGTQLVLTGPGSLSLWNVQRG